MELTRELLMKAKGAKSVEELMTLAKANDVEMTTEEAGKMFAQLQRNGELLDDELDNVSGGCSSGDEGSDDRRTHCCKYCGSTRTIIKDETRGPAVYCAVCKGFLGIAPKQC